MLIIGCDFHTRYQQIAMANNPFRAAGPSFPCCSNVKMSP